MKDYRNENIVINKEELEINKNKIVDTLQYQMADKFGHFLGNGFTDIKENKLEYKTNVSFPYKGDYSIHVQHAMRKTRKVEGLIFLDGITDVGVKIEKTN